MSGKSYAYTQLGLSFLQDTRYKYSSELMKMVMTQLSLKAALKQWGKDAKAAVEAEAKQLYWHNSFRPVHWKDVNKERQKQILELHVFVKNKRTGQIKAHKLQGATSRETSSAKRMQALPQ
jgi:hypothetical protein